MVPFVTPADVPCFSGAFPGILGHTVRCGFRGGLCPPACRLPCHRRGDRRRGHQAGYAGTCSLRKMRMFRILSYRTHHSFPPFTDRHRIKINYGIILAQHLVSCQLNNTISSVFSLSIFVRKNPSAKFILLFLFFSSICFPVRYFFFRLSCYSSSFVSGIRSLTTEEHTPSCIWVPVNGSLL